ncbi:MAG TPA: PKD domain-containing protein, partial [Nitrososphaeraceae archaeon]|nr:PKD domain-containing protein [Nitrososphaeraceae archaeon]
PVNITANITSDSGMKLIDWTCTQKVNFSVTTDRRTLNFTPSANGVYNFRVTVTDDNNVKTAKDFTITVGSGTTTPPTEPPTTEPPTTPPPTTGAKYDSNIQGNMNNGVARFVTDKEGNTDANGFGFTVNASGGGGIRCLGNGQFNIEPASQGYRRMYICATNYNARLEGEFAFLDAKPRNFSIKTRNRHQYGDMVDSGAPDSKRQGGLGIHFSIEEQNVGFQYETVHGTNGGSVDKPLPKNLEVGKWYKYKYTYKDASSSTVNIKVELDYGDGQGFKTVMDITPSVPSVFFVKSDFDTWSQFWLRNNEEGKIGNRNVRLFLL